MTQTMNSRAVTRSAFTDQPSGMIIGERRSPWSVIIPEAGTNLITNPSFEFSTTGWGLTQDGASSANRTGGASRFGAYVGYLIRSGGTTAYLTSNACAVSASSIVTMSVYLATPTPASFFLTGFEYNAAVAYIQNFTAIGVLKLTPSWQRVTATARVTASTAYVALVVSSTANGTVLIDGAQVEEKPYATTYMDGDQEGCYWTIGAHNSPSNRQPNDRRGGRVWNFRDFKFKTTAMLGFGAAALSTVVTPYALIGGGNYQRSIAPPRQLSIVGGFQCDSDIDLKRNRQSMINALAPYAANVDQPARLIYNLTDCEDELGSNIVIDAVYTSGLEGNWTNDVGQENVALNFTSFLPLAVLGKSDVDDAAALTINDDWPGLTGIFRRSRTTGDWEDITLALPATPNIVVSDGFNTVYALGVFSGGNYGMYRLQRDSGTGAYFWSSISTANGQINDAAVGANGYLYVVGDFTSIGAAGTTGVAYFDGSLWHPLSTTATGLAGGAADGDAIKIASNGYIYIGGDFTSVDSVAASNVAYWNGAVWNPLGAGVDAGVLDIDEDPAGNIYVGGRFDNAGGATAVGLARWNWSLSSWEAIGDLDSTIRHVSSILVAADGRVYVAGYFLTIGGVSSNGLAYYNGSAWSALGTGLSPSGSSTVVNLSNLASGNVMVTGNQFTSAGGLSANRMAEWTGSQWLPGDMQTVGSGATPTVGKVVTTADYEYVIATATTELMTSEATTVTNTGGPVTPTLRLVGPGRVHSLRNWSTGARVSFDLVLLAGEVVTLKFGNQPTFISSARGNLINSILPGSNLANFKLARGANYITILYDDSAAGASAALIWRNEYDSLDASAV